MSQKAPALMLPFSVVSENREEPFTNEMEKAAVYCLAELGRSKGGGLVLKKPSENVLFLAQLGYPLWLLPWGKLNLLFDGFKTTAHTLTYTLIPDVKTFIENAKRSSKTLETYTSFLSDNINYFQASSTEKTLTIDALITEPNFLNESNLYLSEAKEFETQRSEMTLLSPIIDEPTISSIALELENLKSKFEGDVNILYDSMKLLNKTTRNFVKSIRQKIRSVKEEFAEEIRKQESIVTPKVERINDEYNEQIIKVKRDFEKQLFPLQKEKAKLEKTKEQLLSKIEQYQLEAKTSATKKDIIGEQKWKEKVAESKKELSEIEAKIREVERNIKEIDEGKSLETFRLRAELEAKLKEAKKDLLELEASQDAKIQSYQREIENLESLTATVIKQIDSIARSREANLANFGNLGTKQRYKNLTPIYVPFYLVCYQAGPKRRYVLFPPSVANSVSFAAKIKSALGKARIKQLLVPRFKGMASFLNKFLVLAEQSAVFERELYESGEKTNILKVDSSLEQIKSGLKKLMDEGWLSEKEYETLIPKVSSATG